MNGGVLLLAPDFCAKASALTLETIKEARVRAVQRMKNGLFALTHVSFSPESASPPNLADHNQEIS